MHDQFDQLRLALVRLGVPARDIRKLAREIAEHWEDLEREGRERGLDDADAVKFANERLGDPEALARQFAEEMRRVKWWWRHSLVTFIVLPPITLILWFAAWALLFIGVSDLGKFLFADVPDLTDSQSALSWTVQLIHYSGLVLVPVFFWRLAQRSYCAVRCGWWACAACAVHSLFNYVNVQPHSLSWGYGMGMSIDWLPVLVPLIVGMFSHWREWQRRSRLLASTGKPRSAQARLAVAFLTALLLNGCASSEAPRQRGWIGGEYKVAKTGRPFTTSPIVAAFPRELKATQSAAIFVVNLHEETPAALGGLREGDLILKVGSEPVESLDEFRELIDASEPGTIVPLTIYRDEATVEQEVIVGRERFKHSHWLGVGLMLSSQCDLWPNPDFSLVALGYKRDSKRTELHSSEAEYIRRTRSSHGLESGDGWQMWLGVISVGGRNRILSQEAVQP